MTVGSFIKRLCSFVFALCFVFILLPRSYASAVLTERNEPPVITASMVGQGNIGAEHIGYYAISTPEQLLWFMERAFENGDISALLTSDITLNSDLTNQRIDTDPVTGEPIVKAGIHVEEWTPILSFGGVIDGGGHAICGLYINNNEKNTGLVSTLNDGGIIKNLEVRNSYVFSSGANTGAIAGINYGSITGVSVYSDVASTSDNIGAIVGENRGIVEKCSSHSVTQGKNFVGGIVGLNYGKVGYSFVESERFYPFGARFVGSIAGKNDGKIYSCYSMKSALGETFPMVGDAEDDAIFEDCFYLSDTEVDAYEGTEHKNLEAFRSGEVCYLLNDENEVFFQTVGVGVPSFNGESVYLCTVKNCPLSDPIETSYANVPNTTVLNPDHYYVSECDRFCEFCNNERNDTKMHTYVDNCDEFCEDCDEIRVPLHRFDNECDTECGDCDFIRDVDNHIFDNECDTICNRENCTFVREVDDHTYINECDTSCEKCGFIRLVDDHIFDNACDSNCNRENCGFERENAPHIYDSCVDIDCNECSTTRDDVGHVYDNVCDAICNVCEFQREVSGHQYDNSCDTECNVCKFSRETGDHEYDDDCDVDCNICGDNRTPKDHVYDNVCDVTCNVCKSQREVSGHQYENACDVSCDLCGEPRIVGEHIFDNACDSACNECGASRNVGDHVYENDCDETCDECGDCRIVGEHIYDNICDVDCNICGDIREVVGHFYDNSCDESCNLCGTKRQTAGHEFGEYFIVLEPTETEEGMESRECKNCGKRESRTVEKVASNNDTFIILVVALVGVTAVIISGAFIAIKIYGKRRLSRF